LIQEQSVFRQVLSLDFIFLGDRKLLELSVVCAIDFALKELFSDCFDISYELKNLPI